ncbi:hypothetical protein MKZ26_03425 [Sporosarcina sp. FSL K6-6792]|uniref:hypothetical protein n=1 Tax=Sporosarcina sp. FSL K6-6792 TaxID=2921559 RepID=UPI0030FCE833
MSDWINGGGFYLVQSTRNHSPEELKREMDELEVKIQTAERYWAERKAMTA